MHSRKDLAIILPIYNPSEGWELTLRDHLHGLKSVLTVEYVVILVNDGSEIDVKGGVDALLKEYKELTYHGYEVNEGKGHALRQGVGKIEATNYILTDFDIPFGLLSVVKFSEELDGVESDVLLGKRSDAYFSGLPIKRRVLSKVFNYFTFPFLGFKHFDTQTGIKGFNQRGKGVFLQTKTNSYVYDFEFVRIAVKASLRIRNIEVSPIETISFSNFGSKTIFKELASLFRILIRG
jgi:hypothetical protein